MNDDEEKYMYVGQVYHTFSSSSGMSPPLVTTKFSVQDDGKAVFILYPDNVFFFFVLHVIYMYMYTICMYECLSIFLR